MYKEIISPLLDKLPSEPAHSLTREGLHLFEKHPFTLKILEKLLSYKHKRFSDERLKVSAGGIIFENPLIVGAGWDKNGRAVRALYSLGFSSVEVGSVLEYPQKGNPKPRQWYFNSGVALNHLGFNSPGASIVAKNLERYRNVNVPIGISIGINKNILDAGPESVFLSIQKIAEIMLPYADYFALNPASPNSPGLRAYQTKELLERSVLSLKETLAKKAKARPLFIKISPDLDLSQIDNVVRVVLDNNLAGIIAANTTNRESIKAKYAKSTQPGGISGNDPEFRELSTGIIRHIYRESGDQVQVIGVGGVNSTSSALEKITAGSRALQIVTAVREVGPTIAGRINRGLVQEMERLRINSLEEIRGSDFT